MTVLLPVCTFGRVFDTTPLSEVLTLAKLTLALRRFEVKPQLEARIEREVARIGEAVERGGKGAIRAPASPDPSSALMNHPVRGARRPPTADAGHAVTVPRLPASGGGAAYIRSMMMTPRSDSGRGVSRLGARGSGSSSWG